MKLNKAVIYLLIVTFLGLLFCDTSGSTDFYWQLFTGGVSNKFTWLLFDVLGGTR